MQTFELTPKLIGRAGSVDRWQIVRTARKQTLAEHSFMVAMYALILADAVGIPDSHRYDMVLYALHHDLSEILTGDISTVAKNFIREEIAYDDHTTNDPFSSMDKIVPVVDELKSRATGEAKGIVKLADLLDAVAFLHIESISDHGGAIKSRIMDRVDHMSVELQCTYPEYNWHMGTLKVMRQIFDEEDISL